MTKGENVILLDTTEAKYIRFTARNMAGKTVSIAELELYFTGDISPSDALALDIDEVTVKPDGQIVSSDLTLITKCTNGSTVVWTSSHPEIISETGKLTRPKNDTLVTLTATITSKDGSITEKRSFLRTVKGNTVSSSGGGGGGKSTSVGGIKDAGTSIAPYNLKNDDETDNSSQSDFKDVPRQHWSYEYVKELKDAYIIEGDGKYFYPVNDVKREEFIKMLVLSLDIMLEGEAVFEDVSEDKWYYEYIAAAYEAGITVGNGGKFGVGKSITRQDMAVMVMRALNKLDIRLEMGEPIDFKDGEQISGYAKEAVTTLCAAGILNGNGGYFAPHDSLTREQAAKVLCLIRRRATK